MTCAPPPASLDTDRQREAVAHCSAGRFAEALALLQPLIDAADDARADGLAQTLNIAAVSALGLGQLAHAEHWWRRCVELQPGFVEAHNSLGILLKGLQRPAEAASAWGRVLELQPANADAHNSVGAALYDLGQHTDAEAAYRRALAARPDHAAAHYNLGILLHELKRLDEAEAAYRAALHAQPRYDRAFNNLGNVLNDLGRTDEAEAAYRDALNVRPQYPEALNNLANLLKASRRFPEAELACRIAITVRPDYAEAHNNLGAVLAELGRLPEAETSYRRALALRPDYAEARYNLGIALHALDRLPEAESTYREVLRQRPEAIEARNNLGCTLRAQHRLAEAAATFREVLALSPTLAEAQHNLGSVLKELGELDEAETRLRTALALRPDYADAHFGLAVLLLSQGHFEEGWIRYESRYAQAGFVHHKTRALLQCPQWQGETLEGKRVLVFQEDGLGDMLQFSRYLPLIKARGAAHVTFAGMPALHRLIGRIDGVDAVLDHEQAIKASQDFDCWSSLLSLPKHCRTALDTIPSAVPPQPDPALDAQWRARLDALPPGPRIGLVWKGNPRHHNDAHRSIPSLAALAPLWQVPGVQFVSLQKGAGEEEAKAPPAAQPLLALGSEVNDFADTAAVVAQLDLVICVDTSTAHLAGMLGTPCWVLLPGHDIDWRWMHGRSDSPWYPRGLRVFRQGADEGWGALAERVREACGQWVQTAAN